MDAERLKRVTVYDDNGDLYGEYFFSSIDDNSIEVDNFMAMLEDVNGEVHMCVSHYVEDKAVTERSSKFSSGYTVVDLDLG